MRAWPQLGIAAAIPIHAVALSLVADAIARDPPPLGERPVELVADAVARDPPPLGERTAEAPRIALVGAPCITAVMSSLLAGRAARTFSCVATSSLVRRAPVEALVEVRLVGDRPAKPAIASAATRRLGQHVMVGRTPITTAPRVAAPTRGPSPPLSERRTITGLVLPLSDGRTIRGAPTGHPPLWGTTASAPPTSVAPPEPGAPATSGLLGPTGSRFRSRTFDVDVAPDGSAKIRDNRNFRWGPGPRPAASERPPTREEDIERPILNPVRPVGATIATFDVTDWAMRSRGIDPYASQKLAVLDATRGERARIGARHRSDQLARTPDLVRASLAELATLPIAAQKRALFELWDDCAETGPGELVAAGAAARAAIVAHIRARFPPGSPRAFTEDERAALAKQQRSRARFAPY